MRRSISHLLRPALRTWPGGRLILTAADLLARGATPADEEIRHALRGNLCRCTGYQTIVESIQAAGAELAGASS